MWKIGSLSGDDDGNVTVTKQWALISCTMALHGRFAFWYNAAMVGFIRKPALSEQLLKTSGVTKTILYNNGQTHCTLEGQRIKSSSIPWMPSVLITRRVINGFMHFETFYSCFELQQTQGINILYINVMEIIVKRLPL